ncbi:MAG: PAS domain-containing protein [Acidobacteria bacterium]|nr:PAS domain-containing protein [Acidobacteriota bacterium]
MSDDLSTLTTFAPGFAAALLALLLVGLGYWLGRRRKPRGVRALERTLREMAAGRYDVEPDLASDDPAHPAALAATQLAHQLAEQRARREPRAAALAEALRAVPGRGILVLDRDMLVRDASDGAAALWGERPTGLAGRAAESLFGPASWKEYLPSLIEQRRRPGGAAGRLEIARPGLAPLALRAQGASVETPEDGTVLWLDPIEESLAAVEPPELVLARLRGIVEALADGVAVVSGGRVLEANPAARAMLGADLAGTLLRDMVCAEDLLLVLDRVGRAEAGETVDPLRCRLVPRDPALRPREVEIEAVSVRYDGRPAAALTLRDTSPEHAARRRARIHEARLLAVLDAVADGLVLLSPPAAEDSPWRVSLVNRRALETLGLDGAAALGAPEDELRGMIAHLFREPARLVAYFENAARATREEHRASFDLAAPPARSLEVFLRPVLDAEGALLGRVLVARDITRHREAERRLEADAAALTRSRESLQRAYEDLATIHHDLERKTGEMDRLNHELVELDRARAQLLADVSHELQTPLVSIRGYTQMVLEGRLGKINDEQRRGLEVALRNIDRMVEMIVNLVALARSEAAGPLAADTVDAVQVIGEVLERHEPDAARRSVQLETKVLAGGAQVLSERDGLAQVLDNLVGNAVKFNRPGGRVTVSLLPGPEGFVELEVADTGVGIPSEERERIFDRFYRGRGASGVAGSGIGLATVRGIVVRHGGKVDVESAPGQGSVFRVRWPRAASQRPVNVGDGRT